MDRKRHLLGKCGCSVARAKRQGREGSKSKSLIDQVRGLDFPKMERGDLGRVLSRGLISQSDACKEPFSRFLLPGRGRPVRRLWSSS